MRPPSELPAVQHKNLFAFLCNNALWETQVEEIIGEIFFLMFTFRWPS